MSASQTPPPSTSNTSGNLLLWALSSNSSQDAKAQDHSAVISNNAQENQSKELPRLSEKDIQVLEKAQSMKEPVLFIQTFGSGPSLGVKEAGSEQKSDMEAVLKYFEARASSRQYRSFQTLVEDSYRNQMQADRQSWKHWTKSFVWDMSDPKVETRLETARKIVNISENARRNAVVYSNARIVYDALYKAGVDGEGMPTWKNCDFSNILPTTFGVVDGCGHGNEAVARAERPIYQRVFNALSEYITGKAYDHYEAALSQNEDEKEALVQGMHQVLLPMRRSLREVQNKRVEEARKKREAQSEAYKALEAVLSNVKASYEERVEALKKHFENLEWSPEEWQGYINKVDEQYSKYSQSQRDEIKEYFEALRDRNPDLLAKHLGFLCENSQPTEVQFVKRAYMSDLRGVKPRSGGYPALAITTVFRTPKGEKIGFFVRAADSFTMFQKPGEEIVDIPSCGNDEGFGGGLDSKSWAYKIFHSELPSGTVILSGTDGLADFLTKEQIQGLMKMTGKRSAEVTKEVKRLVEQNSKLSKQEFEEMENYFGKALKRWDSTGLDRGRIDDIAATLIVIN